VHVTVSDLLFILVFSGTAFSLAAAAWFAFRHQFQRSWRILAKILICAAVYFTVVISASLILPRRFIKQGDLQCFDDFCVSVDGFERVAQGTLTKYEVRIRLSSRARGAVQREKNLVAFLTDNHARRYDPVADNTYIPLNIRLEPQESVLIGRSFLVPVDAKDVGAVITHEGGFPIGWFIIGYDAWFRKPPIVPLIDPSPSSHTVPLMH
jgi:hypothetical protein